jgi:protein-tyrosine-phosphatase
MIKPKVLFLCSDNGCRTQMAEAFLRDMADERFEALSAGGGGAARNIGQWCGEPVTKSVST